MLHYCKKVLHYRWSKEEINMTKFEKLIIKIQLANAMMEYENHFVLDYEGDYNPVLKYGRITMEVYARGIDEIDDYLSDFFKLTFKHNTNVLEKFLAGRIF